jgi:Tat protein secretion system quality control protein TatD with DNase activity
LSKNSEDYYITIGVHPCRATEVFKNKSTVENYQKEIENTIEKYFDDKSKLVAIGE